MSENTCARVFGEGANVGRNVLKMLAVQVAVVVAALALDSLGFSEATVVIVFVLGVLLTALFTFGPAYSMTASVLSILCFNFLFVAPRFSFRIDGADVPGTLAVMFVVALVSSYVVAQMRKNAQKSAEASARAHNEQLRANLLRSVSHDLRTPLTSISGNADVLLDEDVSISRDEQRRLVRTIRDDAAWLAGTVENLLAITRFENGEVELRREVDLVDDVVEEALRHASRDLERHELVVVPSDELLPANMDAQLIVQVVVNLVNNAVTHTQDGSQIRIVTGRVGSFAYISVADNGPGVSEQDKAHIFEPYYSSGRAIADGRRGVGLGLSVCRSIVDAHGGELRVEDVVPQGAKFTFTLPLADVVFAEGV